VHSNCRVGGSGLRWLAAVTSCRLRRVRQDWSIDLQMPAKVVSKQVERKDSPPTTRWAQIHRERKAGLALTRIDNKPLSEFHLTVTPTPGETDRSMAQRLAAVLNEFDATVVQQIVFGSIKAHRQTIAALRQALDDPGLPVTWVEGAACDENQIAGIQVHAIAGTHIRTIGRDDMVRGRIWSDEVATHCVLGVIRSSNITLARADQAQETFVNLQTALIGVGMGMKDLARTWFFLDDILSWYDDFNRVRNDCFARSELRPGSVPASTGVSGVNPAKAALMASAWAIQPHDPSTRIVEVVPSPRQCPAPAYGSAFSRAVELHLDGLAHLLVSGTASIEPNGRTTHVGDVRAQIGLTMQVVEAILESRGMSFADTSRATAYFKRADDAPVFDEWLSRHGLSALPVVRACCNICRDDLLFELELDAIRATG